MSVKDIIHYVDQAVFSKLQLVQDIKNDKLCRLNPKYI